VASSPSLPPPPLRRRLQQALQRLQRRQRARTTPQLPLAAAVARSTARIRCSTHGQPRSESAGGRCRAAAMRLRACRRRKIDHKHTQQLCGEWRHTQQSAARERCCRKDDVRACVHAVTLCWVPGLQLGLPGPRILTHNHRHHCNRHMPAEWCGHSMLRMFQPVSTQLARRSNKCRLSRRAVALPPPFAEAPPTPALVLAVLAAGRLLAGVFPTAAAPACIVTSANAPRTAASWLQSMNSYRLARKKAARTCVSIDRLFSSSADQRATSGPLAVGIPQFRRPLAVGIPQFRPTTKLKRHSTALS
jgi:hypothetical protein